MSTLMLQKNHIIQETGMLEKLSSGHLETLNTGIPSILQRPLFVKACVTHKIPNKAALERFGSIPAYRRQACRIGFMQHQGQEIDNSTS